MRFARRLMTFGCALLLLVLNSAHALAQSDFLTYNSPTRLRIAADLAAVANSGSLPNDFWDRVEELFKESLTDSENKSLKQWNGETPDHYFGKYAVNIENCLSQNELPDGAHFRSLWCKNIADQYRLSGDFIGAMAYLYKSCVYSYTGHSGIYRGRDCTYYGVTNAENECSLSKWRGSCDNIVKFIKTNVANDYLKTLLLRGIYKKCDIIAECSHSLALSYLNDNPKNFIIAGQFAYQACINHSEYFIFNKDACDIAAKYGVTVDSVKEAAVNESVHNQEYQALKERMEKTNEKNRERNAELAQEMANRNAFVNNVTHYGNLLNETSSEQVAAILAVGTAQVNAQSESAKGANSRSQPAQPYRSSSLQSPTQEKPVLVRLTHSLGANQGYAKVTSNPAGISCPSACSARFGPGFTVSIIAQADQQSVVRDISCLAYHAADTGPMRPGNSRGCGVPGSIAREGGVIDVVVDSITPATSTDVNTGGGYRSSGGTVTGSYDGTSGGSMPKLGQGDVYVSGLPGSCIETFSDPQVYGWISFKNNCGQKVAVVFISKKYPYSHAEMILNAGHKDSTGYSPSEVAAKGGYSLYICPEGYEPEDRPRHRVEAPNLTYSCRKIY